MTDIEVLGEIRCRYNLFDVKEQRYYEALSNAIQALSNASNALKPLTNADRIRQMSDEELATYLTDFFYNFTEHPGMCDVCDRDSMTNCTECWLEWLKQEVESDG